MKITYDKEVDAKYVSIKEGKIYKTKSVKDWLILDLDEKNQLLGVEILDASKNLVSIFTEGNKYSLYSTIRILETDDMLGIGNLDVNLSKELSLVN